MRHCIDRPFIGSNRIHPSNQQVLGISEGPELAERALLAVRKLSSGSRPSPSLSLSLGPGESPKAPVVVPWSRSSSVCSSSLLLGTSPAAALSQPAVVLAHPDATRCDVVIRCRILNARLPPIAQLPVPQQRDSESEAEADEGKDEESCVPSPLLAPGQEERKEVSSGEEQEQEQGEEQEGAGKRKRAVSTTEDSGVEGHKKPKAAGKEAACTSERSCSSISSGSSLSGSSASCCSTLTAAAGTKADGSSTTPEKYQVRMIHAEGAVLAAQSRYFAQAFGGGWKETGSRELTLTLDDEDGGWGGGFEWLALHCCIKWHLDLD